MRLQDRASLLSIVLIFIAIVQCSAQNEVAKKQNIFPISLDSLTRTHAGSRVIDYSMLRLTDYYTQIYIRSLLGRISDERFTCKKINIGSEIGFLNAVYNKNGFPYTGKVYQIDCQGDTIIKGQLKSGLFIDTCIFYPDKIIDNQGGPFKTLVAKSPLFLVLKDYKRTNNTIMDPNPEIRLIHATMCFEDKLNRIYLQTLDGRMDARIYLKDTGEKYNLIEFHSFPNYKQIWYRNNLDGSYEFTIKDSIALFHGYTQEYMENAANPRSYGPSAPIAVFEDKEGIPMGLLKNPDGGPYPPLLLKPVKKVPGNTLFEGKDKIGSTITYQLEAYPKIEDTTIYLERVQDIFKVPYPMENKW